MSLQDAFTAAGSKSDTKLDSYRSKMSKEDATALESALSSGMSHTDIARVLTSQGFPIGEASIRRERERRNMIVMGL